MLIVTINEVPGKKIEALGVVRGSTVQSRNLGHDIMAGFRTLVGGEVTDYAEMLTEARQIATGRMAKNAEELGADAVVGMRYASASVMPGAAEAPAYGTAVRFVSEPKKKRTYHFNNCLPVVWRGCARWAAVWPCSSRRMPCCISWH